MCVFWFNIECTPLKKKILIILFIQGTPACSGVQCGTETCGISSLGWSSLTATLASEPRILTGQLDASRPVQPPFRLEASVCSPVRLVEVPSGLYLQSSCSLECPTRSARWLTCSPDCLLQFWLIVYSCSLHRYTCSPDWVYLEHCPHWCTGRPHWSTCSHNVALQSWLVF